jgi:DNA-binding transcriptional regulator PaaX
MRNPKLREAVEDLSYGLLSTSINLSLSLIHFSTLAFSGRKSPATIWKAAEEASNLTGINKSSLKHSFWKAKHKGLLKRKRKHGKEIWTLTRLGRKRLTSELPIYQKQRPWNGRLYLITYDIPEEMHYQRNSLRKQLKKLGAGMFQHSVYIMFWDPTKVLRTLIKQQSLKGQVIVSDTGTDGSIGEIDIDELIWKVFKLEELNTRYEKFLTLVKEKTLNTTKLAFHYLTILKNDPQLPFELLGPNWLGTKAYNKFRKLTKN